MKRAMPIFITVVMVALLFATAVYGDTWTATRRLTRNSGDSEVPVIAVVQSNIYVVWSDDSAGNYEIFLRMTNNAGASWSPALAVNGSSIYVVWEDNTPGNGDIYFKNGVLD